jgi:hypothetical protein
MLIVPAGIHIDENAFVQGVLQEWASALRRVLTPAYAATVESRVSVEALVRIRASSAYASLHGGVLQAELGVKAPTTAIEGVLQGLAGACRATIDPPRVLGNSLVGSVTVGILRTDLSDVLSRPEASFVSEKGYQVDWLDWLLTQGDRVVVGQYGFLPANKMTARSVAAFSRTGLGIMRQANHGWSVPPEFSGTPGDNWFTRALAAIERVMADILVDELRRRL